MVNSLTLWAKRSVGKQGEDRFSSSGNQVSVETTWPIPVVYLKMLKMASQQGRRRRESRRRALLGYVEDSCELRTMLGVIFSILSERVRGSFNKMTLLGRAEANLEDHPAAFFTVYGGNGGID